MEGVVIRGTASPLDLGTQLWVHNPGETNSTTEKLFHVIEPQFMVYEYPKCANIMSIKAARKLKRLRQT